MKSENKKIRNATPTSYGGINFKSTIEARIYKALLDEGIAPEYEAVTFTLSPSIRPTVPFYNRTKKRGFHYEMHPIQAITYTPDFTFNYNDVAVIIEVKGIENDSFPIKRNLFRKLLEERAYDTPVMYFEIRSKRELLEAINIVKMETSELSLIRRLVLSLPEKDIPVANGLLESRDFTSLLELVQSSITRVENSQTKGNGTYAGIKLEDLHRLSELTSEFVYDA